MGRCWPSYMASLGGKLAGVPLPPKAVIDFGPAPLLNKFLVNLVKLGVVAHTGDLEIRSP